MKDMQKKFIISPWVNVRWVEGKTVIWQRNNGFRLEYDGVKSGILRLIECFVEPTTLEDALTTFGSTEGKLIEDFLPELIRQRFILATIMDRGCRRPQFLRNPWKIEIDITWECDVYCINCNRSCRQAPTNERMTIEQIEKFVDEAVSKNILYDQIFVSGGEPTLHPELLEIIDILIHYKKSFSKDTKLLLYTNGFSEKGKNILTKIPSDVAIENSSKTGHIHPHFHRFNVAPIDTESRNNKNWEAGCTHAALWAMGLGRYGYYQCPLAASIDRVVGYDIGRKELPTENDTMIDQMKILCKYCGLQFPEYTAGKSLLSSQYAPDSNRILDLPDVDGAIEDISPTWQKIYKEYKKKKPTLTLY